MISRKDLLLKNTRRHRRKRHIRRKVFGSLEKPRLTVHRSLKNISGQLIDDYKGVTLVAVSTQQEAVRSRLERGAGNCAAAALVGRLLGEAAKAKGIEAVQFDRNGYRYHGRVKALAEALREAGMRF